ncbi:MAG: hypothetical protein A3E38_02390 [Candidatus Moranbacteria bacterium RIFCSPHIGHO2_12_FULL_54_9]|nr:MAG: hypothetical protein A2878_02870 [Candidatus Moranbacteria bacterium RIFCSPHIGHO2_01_FULL_54_31]OGI26075.1 MAG: hypothetical protein A3E38_02390 [Candidatus Moranbacteria bacterium RIFCSPHIGHO2_12_FULL_54_9]
METFKNYCLTRLAALRESGALSLAYALLAEALFLGYLGFAALFTVEMLLPTFITARLSLAKFFFILFLLSFALTGLGRFLDMSFEWKINKKSPALWLGLCWMLGILLVSLYKFPPLTIPVIIAGFFFTGFLFWNILFGEGE